MSKSKSYKCEKLGSTLHFLPNRVAFCCECCEGAHLKDIDFCNFDIEKINNKRFEYLETLKNGIIPKECMGCTSYTEDNDKFLTKLFKKDKNPDKKITNIIIDHFKSCDCKCIYCTADVLYPNVTQSYELLPIMKKLYESGMIDRKNLYVEFQGGNVSLLNEFSDLLNVIFENGYNRMTILTNGIKYLPEIENVGKNGANMICVSLDCGTKETYQKIKLVDAFDIVINNLRKVYKNTNLVINLKYIILEGINDNIDELAKFLEFAKEFGSRTLVSMEIDYRKLFINNPEKFVIPKVYYEMFKYSEMFCKKNNLRYMMYPYTKQVLDRGSNF